ncbi:MAG: hypothetical protein ACNA8W_04455 [Bradymonadaceae bacterium]
MSDTRSIKTILFLTAFAFAAFAFGSTALGQDAALDRALSALPALTLIHAGDATGTPNTHEPGLPEAGKLRVYWFWSSVSPCSRRTENLVADFARAHPDVELFVIHANANEKVDQARRVATQRGFVVPIYRDEGTKLAVALDARITPEAIVLDSDGIVYRGKTDGSRRGKTENYVADAVKAWKAGATVDPASRAPSGCPIQRP